MNAKAAKDTAKQWIDRNRELFDTAADAIFDNPELGMQEHTSVTVVADLLTKNGFTVEMGVAGMPTAFVAVYGSGKPVIGFSAEYDALPGLSQDRCAERNPIQEGAPGQGCGHNLLGVGGACAAIGLKQAMEQHGLKGTIKVYGTPAEELCIGKPFMARAGIFDDADIILDWHPFNRNFVAYHTNAYFNVYYHFKGKTSHGNAPWNGRSALDAAMLMGHAAEMLREHIAPGPEGAANTFNYTFPDVGPEFPSVVPDKTTAWYVGRFSSSEVMEDFMHRLDNCAEGAALASGTTVEKEFVTAIHEMLGNQSLARVIYDNWDEAGPLSYTEEEQNFARDILKNAGAEITRIPEELDPFAAYNAAVTDASEYSWFAPEASVFVSMAPTSITWHNWQTTALCGHSAGKKSVIFAGKLLACTGIDLILKPELVQKAQAEYREKLAGRQYKSLLPDSLQPPLDINRKTMEKYR